MKNIIRFLIFVQFALICWGMYGLSIGELFWGWFMVIFNSAAGVINLINLSNETK